MGGMDYESENAKTLPPKREPCVVCGHPTGDCASENSTQIIKLLGVDIFPSMGLENLFVVQEDVWQERWLSPFTKTKILVAKKGNTIPMSKAVFLGLVTENSGPEHH